MRKFICKCSPKGRVSESPFGEFLLKCSPVALSAAGPTNRHSDSLGSDPGTAQSLAVLRCLLGWGIVWEMLFQTTVTSTRARPTLRRRWEQEKSLLIAFTSLPSEFRMSWCSALLGPGQTSEKATGKKSRKRETSVCMFLSPSQSIRSSVTHASLLKHALCLLLVHFEGLQGSVSEDMQTDLFSRNMVTDKKEGRGWRSRTLPGIHLAKGLFWRRWGEMETREMGWIPKVTGS